MKRVLESINNNETRQEKQYTNLKALSLDEYRFELWWQKCFQKELAKKISSTVETGF